MAFIILGLGCLSCSDGAYAMKAGENKTVLAKTTENHNDSQGDNCPPFCQCTCCCAGYSINHPIAFTNLIITYATTSFSSLSSCIPPGIALSIWQPPQLLS
ncbi:DUF6660 family protein [Cnuella takakiae]|uniref:DUF6660 family protein n=1 Tax=Cnuella takakiae TaxID=1302690 RepID=UPI00373FD898